MAAQRMVVMGTPTAATQLVLTAVSAGKDTQEMENNAETSMSALSAMAQCTVAMGTLIVTTSTDHIYACVKMDSQAMGHTVKTSMSALSMVVVVT